MNHCATLALSMPVAWIVDDDAASRGILELALEASRHGKPDALMIDIRMPGQSGLTLLKNGSNVRSDVARSGDDRARRSGSALMPSFRRPSNAY
jgi:hypothetical protein